MADFAQRPVALDELLDMALERDRTLADWSESALRLAGRLLSSSGVVSAATFNGGAAGASSGGAFSRLLSTSLGQLTHSMIQNESRSLAALGLIAVQALDPERLLPAIGASDDAHQLIVYHGEERARRSILVLDPALPPDQEAKVVPAKRWEWLLMEPTKQALDRAHRLEPELVQEYASLQEAAWVARPRVVHAPAPPMEMTCVPRPPWCVEAKAEVSTAGALVRDASGRLGVTVCHHGAGPVGSPVRIRDGDQVIDSTVEAASQVLDTCFVPVPENFRPAERRGLAGVLEGRAPGRGELHSFQSFQLDQPKDTEVLAVDWDVPFPTPGRQLCVQTRADTNTGDSGSALLNGDDRLVAFAFQRTPYGAPVTVEFSTWVWARSALNELKLTLET